MLRRETSFLCFAVAVLSPPPSFATGVFSRSCVDSTRTKLPLFVSIRKVRSAHRTTRFLRPRSTKYEFGAHHENASLAAHGYRAQGLRTKGLSARYRHVVCACSHMLARDAFLSVRFPHAVRCSYSHVNDLPHEAQKKCQRTLPYGTTYQKTGLLSISESENKA